MSTEDTSRVSHTRRISFPTPNPELVSTWLVETCQALHEVEGLANRLLQARPPGEQRALIFGASRMLATAQELLTLANRTPRTDDAPR